MPYLTDESVPGGKVLDLVVATDPVVTALGSDSMSWVAGTAKRRSVLTRRLNVASGRYRSRFCNDFQAGM